MKQRHTLIYYISSIAFILCFCLSINGQNDSIPNTVNDSVKVQLKYGLRVGTDASKLVRSFLDDEYSGFELMADYRIKKKLYIAGEIGIEEKTDVTDYLNITTKGSYIKAGVDYNMYENWLDMDNMVYSGFRLGASSFSHTLNNFEVYNTDQFWEPQFSSNDSQEFDGLTAFWLELIIGIKAELFTNLYLGLNIQLKANISQTDPDNFTNIYVPGFNKTFDSAGIGVGYGYTISYRIPLYKKDK